jgi:peroxiredoxin
MNRVAIAAVAVMSALSLMLVIQHNDVVEANRALRTRVAILNGEDIPVGNKVSQLVGIGLDGRRVEYSLQSAERPTLVFTLATGCPGCLDSLPAWRRLAQKADDLGVDTVVVSSGWLADLQEYVKSGNDVPGTVMADPTYSTFLGLRLKVTPHAVVFSPGGTVARVWRGAVNPEMEDEIARSLRPSIEGPAADRSQHWP